MACEAESQILDRGTSALVNPRCAAQWSGLLNSQVTSLCNCTHVCAVTLKIVVRLINVTILRKPIMPVSYTWMTASSAITDVSASTYE